MPTYSWKGKGKGGRIQQGVICAENLMMMEKGKRNLRSINYSVIPAVVYTLPEIVSVGTVPQNLKGITVSTVPFTKNVRALIEDDTEGFMKVWLKDGRLLAAQAMGICVSEIIQELANAISLKTPIEQIASIIHAHPTYSEITRSVLEHAMGRAIESRNSTSTS